MTPRPPQDPRLTEQRNPATAEIDQLSALEIARIINDEDQKVAPAVGSQLDALARAISMAEDTFRRGGRLFYVGAGTSGRLGVLDASEMPPTYGTDPAMIQGIIAGGYTALLNAVEGAEDSRESGAEEMDRAAIGRDDFVFGIAASGTTPYVHGALTRAKQRGAKTGFLLCTHPEEWMTVVYDVVITTGAMIRLGKVYGNLMVDLRATNLKLQDRSERILMETLDLERDEARALLHEAGGSVKLAMVMHWTDTDRDTAAAQLARTGGRIGDVLKGEPR